MIPGVSVQFDGIQEDVIRELVRGQHAKDWFAAQRAGETQAAAARDNYARPLVEGLGECKASIDPLVYHAWARKFGTYDCWHKDGDLLRYLTRNFESTRPVVMRNTNRVGWTPEAEASGRRYRKTYPTAA